MVDMEMAHNDRCNIFDVMTSLLDSFVEILLFDIVDLSEEIVHWRTPDIGPIRTRTANRSTKYQLRARIPLFDILGSHTPSQTGSILQ